MSDLSIADHLFFLALGVILPLSNLYRSQKGLEGIHFDARVKQQVYYSNGLFLWLGAFVALGLWWFQSRPLPLLGFQPPVLNRWTLGLSLLFLVLYGLDLVQATRLAGERKKSVDRWHKYTPFMPANREEFGHYVFLAVSAGIAEEIVFRGFFINYLLVLFHSLAYGQLLSVLLPALIFAIGHSYQGARAVLKIFLFSILFGYLFLFSGSLWLVMIIHTLIDLVGGYALMRIIQDEKGKVDEEEE